MKKERTHFSIAQSSWVTTIVHNQRHEEQQLLYTLLKWFNFPFGCGGTVVVKTIESKVYLLASPLSCFENSLKTLRFRLFKCL
jgi:hypothetical protein